MVNFFSNPFYLNENKFYPLKVLSISCCKGRPIIVREDSDRLVSNKGKNARVEKNEIIMTTVIHFLPYSTISSHWIPSFLLTPAELPLRRLFSPTPQHPALSP